MKYVSYLFILILLQLQVVANIAEKTPEENFADKVVVLSVGQKDLVNSQAFTFWQKTLEKANKEKAAAVVLEIDTPGGLAFDTRSLIMDELASMDVPLIAWVKREALSAGAMITYSADRIYMAEGTTIGSAAIVNGTGQAIEKTMRAKLESAFEASMRAVAEKKGRRYDVIQAMMIVDEDNERTIGGVVVKKGGLLNLTASEAAQIIDEKPLLADGIANSLEEVLKAEGLSEKELLRVDKTGFERIAYVLAALSPILIMVGIGGAYLEMKAPGFGFFGLVSLCAFGLFFFGNNVAGNLAGYELLAVFLLGVLLVLLEIFLLPGGIAGILGAVLMLGSLWFSMADGVDFDRARDTESVSLTEVLILPGVKLVAGMLGGLVIMMLGAKYLPDLPLFRRLVMAGALPSGRVSAESPESLVGQTGVALTDLRPSGTIRVENQERDRDAMSRHGFIPSGARVRVVEEGMRLLVEDVTESEDLS